MSIQLAVQNKIKLTSYADGDLFHRHFLFGTDKTSRKSTFIATLRTRLCQSKSVDSS